MPALHISELSVATVDGAGVFDVLMRANKAHLEQEFNKGRIKGPEYSTVYLGGLQAVLQTGLAFVLAQRKNDLEAQLLEKQISLTTVQIENAILEGTVLVAQECKLRAEFDLTVASTLKTNQEIALLSQKTATEKAQTTALGVDADSVVGRQKELYVAQATGFKRDAEQKATKLLIDTWNVRRTTDEGTVADGTNMLSDGTIGRTVTKLLAGIDA